jgi:hypothetical protein
MGLVRAGLPARIPWAAAGPAGHPGRVISHIQYWSNCGAATRAKPAPICGRLQVAAVISRSRWPGGRYVEDEAERRVSGIYPTPPWCISTASPPGARGAILADVNRDRGWIVPQSTGPGRRIPPRRPGRGTFMGCAAGRITATGIRAPGRRPCGAPRWPDPGAASGRLGMSTASPTPAPGRPHACPFAHRPGEGHQAGRRTPTYTITGHPGTGRLAKPA